MPRISTETQGLLLRNTQASDIPALVRMWTDPDVTRFMGGPRDAAWLQKNFTEDAHNVDPWPYDQWPVIEKSSGDLIGYCGFLDKEIDGRPEIELVYVFMPLAWGKGYGTEMALGLQDHAVGRMDLKRLVALIEPENKASVRVAERVDLHRDRNVMRPRGELMLYVFEL